MKPGDPKFEREELEKAIAAQEGLRGTPGWIAHLTAYVSARARYLRFASR